jgi:hypothetical protein
MPRALSQNLFNWLSVQTSECLNQYLCGTGTYLKQILGDSYIDTVQIRNSGDDPKMRIEHTNFALACKEKYSI